MKFRIASLAIIICTVLTGGLWLSTFHGANRDATPETPSLPGSSGVEASREAGILADLINPAKLATLKGDRAANPRLRKIAYWLESSRRSGQEPQEVILQAQRLAGYQKTPRAEADLDSLLRNLDILDRLGCLGENGMEKLRRGNAPIITRGPYAGEAAAVDHILPFSVVKELDTCLFNLEFMPARLNERKAARIGERQIVLARKWHASGLLSTDGLHAVLSQSGNGG